MKKIAVFSLIITFLGIIVLFNDNTLKRKKITLINNYINDQVNTSNINGYLKIDKIDLLEPIYDIKSNLNSLNIGLKISYLKPFVILGHSGRGKLALFNNLNKLKLNDLIELNYDKKTYFFKVDYIYAKEKSKPLVLEGELLLVTCKINDNNNQLIIRAKSVK